MTTTRKYTHVDPVTREVFRIRATDGIEAMLKFQWANDRLSDAELIEKWGVDPELTDWDPEEDIEDVTHKVGGFEDDADRIEKGY